MNDDAMIRRRRDFMALEDGQLALQDQGDQEERPGEEAREAANGSERDHGAREELGGKTDVATTTAESPQLSRPQTSPKAFGPKPNGVDMVTPEQESLVKPTPAKGPLGKQSNAGQVESQVALTSEQPLFTPDQVRAFDNLHRQAPGIYGHMPPLMSAPVDPRFALQPHADSRYAMAPHDMPMVPVVQRPTFLEDEEKRVFFRMLSEERMEMQRSSQQFLKEIQMLRDENVALRMELQQDSRRFHTPPEVSSQNDVQVRRQERFGELHPRRSLFEDEEDGARARQDQEDGARVRQAKEDGTRVQQAKEEGARARQDQEDGTRVRQAKEEGARARQDQEEGTRVRQEQSETGKGRGSGGGWRSMSRERSRSHSKDSRGKEKIEEGSTTHHKSLEVMSLMLQSMQKLMEDRDERAEAVRTTTPDLPQLPEWSGNGPIDMGDWLVLLEPGMSDLSANSELWWKSTLEELQIWYEDHMKLAPLARSSHSMETPAALQDRKWARLERRVASMLLKAIPPGAREEMISGKKTTVFAILATLQVAYQPGGLAEKEIILRNLEQPNEATSIQEAVLSLRKWGRWRTRAQELGVAEPDPSILKRGLTRLTKRVVDNNRELLFRISLARSTLMVDCAPTRSSVSQFANHLQAELEQIAHVERRGAAAANNNKQEVKVKKLEERTEAKGEGKGKGKREEKGGERMPCKFFLTEEGCKKGKQCTWQHALDGQRRCWRCGSTQHLASECPRPALSPEKPKAQKAGVQAEKEARATEGSATASVPSDVVEAGSSASNEEMMKSLIEEAGKMLKGMSVQEHRRSEEEEKGDKLQQLQKQLDALARANVKVLRLTKLGGHGERGLIDSGATHALRGRRPREKVEMYPTVEVQLAGGEMKRMHLSPQGILIGDKDTEPIIPMGLLTKCLACDIQWTSEGLNVLHPDLGQLDVIIDHGCPMLERNQALLLIKQLEDLTVVKMKELGINENRELQWLTRLVHEHPVFRSLPEELKGRLIEEPAMDATALGNRRQRKKWRNEGVAVHLFSGGKDGYPLKRAFEEVGGQPHRLLELDIAHGHEGADLSPSGKAYGALLRLAFDGQIKGLIGGPPCRTRSVLRHMEVEGMKNMPRPLRAWHGEEFGKFGLTSQEKNAVLEDDTLLFRFLLIFVVSEEVRKALRRTQKVSFGMEQPAPPENMEEVVSWWRTEQWAALKNLYDLMEQTFNQSSFGGTATKPTTWAGNLKIQLPLCQKRGEPRNIEGMNRGEIFESSKKLSRWAPGLMREIACALQAQVWHAPVLKRMTYEKWREHVLAHHVPYNKECNICQEACAKEPYHRRSRLPPKAGVLSIDVSGPFHEAPDLFRGTKAKYMLVGAFTWPSQKTAEQRKKEKEDLWQVVADLEEAPEIEDGEEYADDERSEEKQREEEPREEHRENIRADGGLDEELPPEEREEMEIAEEIGQCKKPFGMDLIRLVTPMSSRNQKEVLKAVSKFYLQLKAHGYEVKQLHSDHGGEFESEALQAWCEARALLHTWTAGDQPQSNGRAEQSVGEIKARIRRMLKAAGANFSRWPLAARCLHEKLRAEALGLKPSPPFLSEVYVRKRFWRSKELEPTQEKVLYLGPSWIDHGHWIEREDGSKALTRIVITNLAEPPQDHHWIALEDHISPLEQRKRLREKTAVKAFEVIEEEEEQRQQKEQVDQRRIQKVIEEEMTTAVFDHQGVLEEVLEGVAWLKEAIVEEGNQEILQTKVVSHGEVRRNAAAWIPAIKAELESLMVLKGALKVVEAEEGKKLLREDLAELIPSKFVFTIKPRPGQSSGKLKARLVACGNYIEDQPNQELYAGGAGAVALRLAIALAAQRSWSAIALDARTAFLNAPMKLPEEEGKPPRRALIKPPALLEELQLVKKGAFYEAIMALYGYRQSPRLWNDFRDQEMERMEAEVEGKRVHIFLAPHRAWPLENFRRG